MRPSLPLCLPGSCGAGRLGLYCLHHFSNGADMAENIGIIAGGGQFPRLIAQDARAAGLGVVICGLPWMMTTFPSFSGRTTASSR